jgi:DNA repair protein RecO (recombination protein O)
LRRLEAGTGGEDLLRIFEIRTLDLAGYRPQLSGCVACGGGMSAGSTITVDIAKGGLLCGDCSRKSGGEIKISWGTTRILEDARRSTLDRLHRLAFSSTAREESRAFLEAFYNYHVGRRLRSTSFLKTMERQTLHGERN